MNYKIEEIEISRVFANSGQLADVPMNYRKITNDNLLALEKSLRECPELLQMRPLITIEHGDGVVVLSGNHRLRAAANVGLEVVPCIVLPADTPAKKLREYAAKDNLEYAETVPELLAMWDLDELQEWNVHVDIAVPEVELIVKPPKEKKEKKNVCPKCGFRWNG